MTLSLTQTAAIKAYSGSAYRAINAYLREGARVDEVIHSYIVEIDKAFLDNRYPADVIVYRGVSEQYAEILTDRSVDIGDIIVDKGYLSASQRKSVAEDFMAGSGGMLFVIRVDARALALDIADISGYPDEVEVLLARGSRLRVLDYDAGADALIVEYAGNEQ